MRKAVLLLLVAAGLMAQGPKARLTEQPTFYRTIAIDFDGPAADGAGYRHKSPGKYSHRVLDGIGHNVPQEAPQAFARVVIDVDTY